MRRGVMPWCFANVIRSARLMQSVGLLNSMSTSRVILIVLGVAVVAVAPMLIVDSYKSRRSQQEALRMTSVKLVVQQKLEAYHEANGRYPDSIDVLSFTNSSQETGMLLDLKKIRYRRTDSGYSVGWDGVYGSWSR
jgi:type II secretory pathway pseudopilin PulG